MENIDKEQCLLTGKVLEEGEGVFYIEAIGGYIAGNDEDALINFLSRCGWTDEEIEESRDNSEGDATVYWTTFEG